MKWEKVKLGELFQIKHGWAFKGEYFSNEGELIIVTPGNFNEAGGFRQVAGKEKYYLGEFPNDFLLKKNDLVIAMTEQGEGLLGSPALIPSDGKYLHNQRIGLIQNVDVRRAALKYLYYLFFTPTVRAPIFGSATGTKVKHTAPRRIYDIQVHIPSVNIQHKIATILSAYDDLIENNLKRIKLLEEQAFLMYKGIVRSEKKEVVKLNEVIQFLKRGISPKYVEDDGIVVLNQKCIRNHIVNFEESRLTDSQKIIPEERMLQKFDALINSTGTGTLGRIAMNIQDEFSITADSHITIVRANDKITPIYLIMSLFTVENVIEMMGEGATNQTELSPKKLGEEIKIQLVSMSRMNEYEQWAESIYNLIWNLQKQNTKLREARDILLPRLMSGEIEV